MTTHIRIKARKSLIWKVSKEDLMKIVNNSKTITEILSHFGLKNIGGNYKTLKNRLFEEDIDYSHIPRGMGHRKGLKFPGEIKSLDECMKSIFVVSTNEYKNHTGQVKKYLKRYDVIPYFCGNCKMEPMWDNKPLSLQLDHINGNTMDNRTSNLRWMCPNCHSQTHNFAGKKLKVKYFCKNCGDEISKNSGQCIKCLGLKKRKTIRPTKEILEKEIVEFPMTILGKKYGVSDNSIKKWCKDYSITLPNRRGYWTKRKCDCHLYERQVCDICQNITEKEKDLKGL